MDMDAVRISLPVRIVARGWRNRIIVRRVSLRRAGLKKGEGHVRVERVLLPSAPMSTREHARHLRPQACGKPVTKFTVARMSARFQGVSLR